MTEKQLNLLKKLEMRNNFIINFKSDNWKFEITYDLNDKVYREKDTNFYRLPVEFLIRIIKNMEKDVELI
jgi:hypothetical protein